MKFDLQTMIAVSSFAMGVGSSFLAFLRWLREAQRKQIVAEREFNHLKRDNEQLRLTVVALDEKVEIISIQLIEMRGAISTLINRGSTEEPTLPMMGLGGGRR